jgi:hypothetical protein
MESSIEDPNPRANGPGTTTFPDQDRPNAWRARYEGSFGQEVLKELGAVNFGDRIIIFGACLLVSDLPLIIVLSAFVGYRIQTT